MAPGDSDRGASRCGEEPKEEEGPTAPGAKTAAAAQGLRRPAAEAVALVLSRRLRSS